MHRWVSESQMVRVESIYTTRLSKEVSLPYDQSIDEARGRYTLRYQLHINDDIPIAHANNKNKQAMVCFCTLVTTFGAYLRPAISFVPLLAPFTEPDICDFLDFLI